MKNAKKVQLEAPRITSGKPLLIAGLEEHYTTATLAGIPKQWQRLVLYLGKVPGQVGRVTYGLCFNRPDGIDYLSGVEVSKLDSLPGELSGACLPAQKYAVFSHHEHVSKLYQTLEAIESQWFPESGYQPPRAAAGAPDFFERYGEGFNALTGMGDIEVWIPIAAREQSTDFKKRIAS